MLPYYPSAISKLTTATYLNVTGFNGEKARHKFLVGGMIANNKMQMFRPVRGAITRSLVRRIIAHPPVIASGYGDKFIFQHAFGLRSEQVGSARLENIYAQRSEDGVLENFIIVLPRHKGRITSVTQLFESHPSDPSWSEDLERIFGSALNRLSFDPSSSDLIFPDYLRSKANDIIKAAAVDLELDPNQDWVNHGIRHGSAIDSALDSHTETLAGQLAAAQERLAHRSAQTTATFYLIDPIVREAQGAAHKALISNKGEQRVSVGNSDFSFEVTHHGRIRVQRLGYSPGQTRQAVIRHKAFKKKAALTHVSNFTSTPVIPNGKVVRQLVTKQVATKRRTKASRKAAVAIAKGKGATHGSARKALPKKKARLPS